MASEGYPGNYETGLPIRGLEEAAKVPDVKVFHAGTATADGQVVTNGGRVLSVTALGNSISAAKLSAYTAVKKSAGRQPGAAKISPTKRCGTRCNVGWSLIQPEFAKPVLHFAGG